MGGRSPSSEMETTILFSRDRKFGSVAEWSSSSLLNWRDESPYVGSNPTRPSKHILGYHAPSPWGIVPHPIPE